MSMATQAFNVQVQFNESNKDYWCVIEPNEKTGFYTLRVARRVYTTDRINEISTQMWGRVSIVDVVEVTDKTLFIVLNELAAMLGSSLDK